MLNKSTSFFALGLVMGALLCAAAFVGLTRQERGQAGTGNATVLRLAHGLDQQHPVHAALEFFAKRVGELSGGELVVKVFPNGQLGSEPECVEQLQRGALAMVKTSAGPMENFVQAMAAFSLPYLFRDEGHYWNVLNGPVGQELLASGASVGIRGLCYMDAGARSFYTIGKPILAPDDARGLKIRTLSSQMARDFMIKLDAGPTPIPWGELYTALQQRMVDGAENNPPSYLSSRHFEVAREFSLNEHTRIPDIIIFSQTIWEKLTSRQHAWIEQAAAESVTFQRDLWREKTAEALELLREAGVTIHYPDQRAFADATASLADGYDGTPVGELIRRIREEK
ncbi:MAG: TRAP transporter substrate-binding protein [Terrimicrobiaceae bacterium]